jgi:hypothetical protein
MTGGGSAQDIVAGFYDDFNRGDISEALSAFAEDLETTDPGMGTVHGIEPFREYLDTFKRCRMRRRSSGKPMRSATS